MSEKGKIRNKLRTREASNGQDKDMLAVTWKEILWKDEKKCGQVTKKRNFRMKVKGKMCHVGI